MGTTIHFTNRMFSSPLVASMRQALLIISLVTGCLISLFCYCAALIDWVQDYKGGVYTSHPVEALLETGAIFIYSFAGLRFFKWRIMR
jgi:hypothetical protein